MPRGRRLFAGTLLTEPRNTCGAEWRLSFGQLDFRTASASREIGLDDVLSAEVSQKVDQNVYFVMNSTRIDSPGSLPT